MCHSGERAWHGAVHPVLAKKSQNGVRYLGLTGTSVLGFGEATQGTSLFRGIISAGNRMRPEEGRPVRILEKLSWGGREFAVMVHFGL